MIRSVKSIFHNFDYNTVFEDELVEISQHMIEKIDGFDYQIMAPPTGYYEIDVMLRRAVKCLDKELEMEPDDYLTQLRSDISDDVDWVLFIGITGRALDLPEIELCHLGTGRQLAVAVSRCPKEVHSVYPHLYASAFLQSRGYIRKVPPTVEQSHSHYPIVNDVIASSRFVLTRTMLERLGIYLFESSEASDVVAKHNAKFYLKYQPPEIRGLVKQHNLSASQRRKLLLKLLPPQIELSENINLDLFSAYKLTGPEIVSVAHRIKNDSDFHSGTVPVHTYNLLDAIRSIQIEKDDLAIARAG